MKATEENKEKIEVENYVLYSPSLSRLTYVRAGKLTGGLVGNNADREFFKLLETLTEIRIQP